MYWRLRFKFVIFLTWLHLYFLSFLITFSLGEGPSTTNCPLDHFLCGDGECIPTRLKCDTHRDCADGDDELECELYHCLAPDYFKCNNGRCVHSIFLCNGDNDCDDNSDEKECTSSSEATECLSNQFRCEDLLCIPQEWACDGKADCVDESDESNSACSNHPDCREDEFQCHSKICIPKKWRCDGDKDCLDGSDEEGCLRRIVPNEECTPDNDGMFLCHDNHVCLESYEVCNNHSNCLDDSDEGGNCSNTQMCDGKCSQPGEDCYRTPNGPVCGCRTGFLRKSGQCKDVDECQNFGVCDQKCENSPGSYHCLCDPGYFLERNRRSCKTEGGEALLVYSTTKEVRGLYLTSQIKFPVARNQKHIIGVAYDGHHIYWTEVYHEEEAIVRSREDGSKMEVIVSAGLGTPEDLAIDWITKNIYFTDSHFQRIGVCINSGLACTVIHARNLDKPRGIALHPKEGLMYWSDWGDNPVISRSGMDGTLVTDFVNKSLHWPNGIVIDYSNERLYWVDAKFLQIESIKLDGTDRRKVLQGGVDHPFSIAVFEGLLYWSDWDGKQIEACNKFTGKDRRIIVREKNNRVYGIHIYHPAIYNYDLDNPCNGSPCSDICLLSPKRSNPKGYKCACPEDKILKSSDDNWCVASETQKFVIIASSNTFYQLEHKKLGKQVLNEIPVKDIGKIGAITYNPITGSLIMSDVVKKDIISVQMDTLQLLPVLSGGMGRVEGLAFDYFGNNLYFSDSQSGKVEVVNFHSWQRKVILQRLGGDVPTDVAVIPEEGLMFVTLFNPFGSHIDRFSMSGKPESRMHIIEHDLIGPFLPLHYSHLLNRVFWADSQTGYIENTDIDGLNRHMFRTLDSSPVSLTSIDYDLFWTNHESKSLFWADTSNGLSGNKLIDLDGIPEAETLKLTVMTGKMTDNKHPCRINNGNCSHICLVDMKDKVCDCPDGMVLKKDGLECMEVPHCEITQFECHLSSISGSSKHCVPRTSHCDHKIDCPEGEDEMNCDGGYNIECPRDKIPCDDGSKCINLEQKCDLYFDCPDMSDELKCFDPENCDEDNEFQCNSGKCIVSSKRCDFHNDCPDESDEQNCDSVTCKPGIQFRCNSGACISSTWACDGEKDCPDGSDEHSGCEDPNKKACSSDKLTCENGQCIDILFKCNGIPDCDDGSDELNCPAESVTVKIGISPEQEPRKHCNETTEFACYSELGTCILRSARCNGSSECPRGEDEIGCHFCKDTEFECENGRCIPSDWVCDKMNDCEDNSDESIHVCKQQDFDDIKRPEERCDGFQCANKQCIHMVNVCDGHNDCGDNSDEGGKCGFSCKNAGCMDICHETPNGPKCACHKGYKLMGDAKTCTDIDECITGQYCSQFCENTQGGFNCYCKHPEYALREDRMSCKAKGSEMEFLFAYGNQIRTISESHSHLGIVYIDRDRDFKLSGLATDVRRKQVYWTSEKNGALYRINIDNIDVAQNVSLLHPSKVAVDWITGNVYVIVEGVQITVCNFDVKVCTPLYTTEPTFKIDTLAVDPPSRMMFWSERVKINQPFSKIYKADLSGANVTAVITTDLEVVSSLSVSSIHNMIYWTESTKHIIERATFNGIHRHVVFTSPDIPIDLAMFEDYAYFLVDSNSMIRRHSLETHGNVWRCGLYGAVSMRCELIRISPVNFGIPYHFEIMHEALQIKGSNDCKRVSCGGICVLSSSGPICVCPDGTIIGENITCPVSNTGRSAFKDVDTGISVGDSRSKSEKKFNYMQWLLIIVACLVLPAVVIFLYQTRLHRNCHLPNFFNRKSASHSIHFDNTSYGLSSVVSNTHAESPFHHTKLNPGEHQYENPINAQLSEDGKVSVKEINGVSEHETVVTWSAVSTNGSSGPFIEDNGSETSSIEYSDVHLDHHKAPLLG